MATVQSYGAATVVTGSCHILQLNSGVSVMVDCGMFQGHLEKKNYEPFGFDPASVDYLLITHAHLDHVGRIPKLVKEGFEGKIVTTRSTFDLAKVVLLDSAHLMESEFHTHFKKAQRRGKEADVRRALYTHREVEESLQLPRVYADYDLPLRLGDELTVIFRNAGHILDSATIEIDFIEEGKHKKIAFSGDLGNKYDYVLPAPERVKEADALYIESTYGDRNHKSPEETVSEFKEIVTLTLLNGGNVMIPSFAIERTQEILCLLKEMYDARELPVCKIFLDSPMAIRATGVYKKYHNELSRFCNDFLERDGNIFEFPYVHYTHTVEESIAINKITSGAIIIAGSGMCSGGRILHHFKHRLWNDRNAVLFVGYQAEGTLGRRMVDGAKWVRIYHEDIVVKSQIHTINGFSAHADQDELIEWMQGFEKLGKIFLIHGEKEKQTVFKAVIKEKLGKEAHIVLPEEVIYL